jgi:hypothetical protein
VLSAELREGVVVEVVELGMAAAACDVRDASKAWRTPFPPVS